MCQQRHGASKTPKPCNKEWQADFRATRHPSIFCWPVFRIFKPAFVLFVDWGMIGCFMFASHRPALSIVHDEWL